MNDYIILDDMDLPWDDMDPKEHLGTMLESLSKVAPSAHVRIRKFIGSGGGWPQGDVIVLREEAKSVLAFFGMDEADIEWWVSESAPLIA